MSGYPFLIERILQIVSLISSADIGNPSGITALNKIDNLI
jgi:hypothetical protein